MALSTRHWRLKGSILSQPAGGVITIDGQTVFDGAFSILEDNGDTFVATGSFELDDEYDTKHSFSLSVTDGVVLVGDMFWNNAYKPNEAITEEERAWRFKHLTDPADPTSIAVPQAILDSVAAKGGWGKKDIDHYTSYPGKNTIYPGLVQGGINGILENRTNILLEGEDPQLPLHAHIMVPVGSLLSFDFGIVGDKGGWLRPA